jgi:type I restriction enzyme M protein
MLDADTKGRIDGARDILVGKLPDPKSQVEQITIALIYKFMDDMDRQSEQLGGKTTFFAGDYKKYRWPVLLDKRHSGHERLLLYAEGIEKMGENPNMPQLFRDIFKGVFLPYRDPETLNLFLKEIDGFNYDHSERLGDAFEYLLSALGSQGEAGQFRTPRHIIDFIVSVVDPQKDDTVLDPACGTAGFLVSSYKWILAKHRENRLTPDEMARLIDNFSGYDISPDMVRLSRVNLYLHGFSNPKIHEYDTLTSEERWDDRYDVILANPPFMTPKGGIRPHKRFSISSSRSEVLFVDYIAEHLNVNGKAGVVVPEGIVFHTQTANKKLRKFLVDDNILLAVASLPAGVFKPYAGVKTSILFFDKVLAKRTDKILFVALDNDGFDLGDQRKPIEKNDISAAYNALVDWKQHVGGGSPFQSASLATSEGNTLAHEVPKSRISQDGLYDLSGDTYLFDDNAVSFPWPAVQLSDVCELVGGGTPSRKTKEFWTDGSVKWIAARHIDEEGNIVGHEAITDAAVKNSATNIVPPGGIVFVTRVSVGKLTFLSEPYAINQDLTGIVLRDQSRVNGDFLYLVMRGLAERIASRARGLGVRGVTRKFMSKLKIPLPPIGDQERIVEQVKALDGEVRRHLDAVQAAELAKERTLGAIWGE